MPCQKYFLCVADSQNKQRKIELAPDLYRLGRHEQCEIVVQCPYISRFHCLVIVDSDLNITITSYSTNSKRAIVNGKSLGYGELRRLTAGDTICLHDNAMAVLIRE